MGIWIIFFQNIFSVEVMFYEREYTERRKCKKVRIYFEISPFYDSILLSNRIKT